jgi:hypothetical protein
LLRITGVVAEVTAMKGTVAVAVATAIKETEAVAAAAAMRGTVAVAVAVGAATKPVSVSVASAQAGR